MIPTEKKGVKCLYYFESDVHFFEYQGYGHDVIDEMAEWFVYLATNHFNDPMNRIVIDTRLARDKTSLNYTLQKMNGIRRRFPQRPVGRVAIILTTSVLVPLLNVMLRTLTIRGDAVRLFEAQQYEDAVLWVRRND